ncbi:hypothetical protein GCM10020331_063110 [Ectobacillus funiculus]
MLIYTSGTTGKPKGTVHTHTGFPLKASFDAAFGMNVQTRDRLMWVTDMGWMMGPFLLFGALINGATMVMYDGVPDAPADRLWEMTDRHRITHLGISPTLIRSLMAKGDGWVMKHSLASLQVIASTGEPWNLDPWLWLFSTVGKGRLPIFFNYSGGTEISGGIFGNVLVRPIAPMGFNSPLPGMAAVVLDGEGRPLVGEVGELCIEKAMGGHDKEFFWEDNERYIDTYWSRYKKINGCTVIG